MSECGLRCMAYVPSQDRIMVWSRKGDDPTVFEVCGQFDWIRLKAIEDQLRENRDEYELNTENGVLVTYHIEVHDYGNEVTELHDVPIEDERRPDPFDTEAAGEGADA